MGDGAVTVCIAARSYSSVFLVSDRMITAGDIQFEPPVAKISFLTSSIAVMASGDSAFFAEILADVKNEVRARVKQEPSNWWLVRDIVDIYIKYRNVAKLKRSEAAILAPLGLDRNSWLTTQNVMDSALVSRIAYDLINFDIPSVSVIIAGVDKQDIDKGDDEPTSHIYSIDNDYVSCDDTIGFRAIGSGARHAESQFMLAGYAWNSNPHMVATIAYRAKRDAEVAPGVGTATDMHMIGSGLGQSAEIRTDIQEKMEQEYQKMKAKNKELQEEFVRGVGQYVDNLPGPEFTAQADKPEIAEAPTESGPPKPAS